MERQGYIVTLEDGSQVLVRQWEDGTVEADTRPRSTGLWRPVAIFGGTVEKVEI